MPYQGIYFRHSLGQVPGGAASGWSASPDIIPAGTTPVDPAQFLGAGYNKDFGSTVYMGESNCVYLRGLNTGGPNQKARLWFYYTASNAVLWPQNWRYDNVLIKGLPGNFTEVTAANPNDIVVTSPPFLWTPKNLDAGQHFCMIAFAENAPLSDPPTPPLPGYMGSFDQLVNFILAHPNMAWRNTIDVSGSGPTWQQTVPVTGPDEGGNLNVGIQCNHMPTDGYYAFSVPGPDKDNTIVVQKSPISNGNMGYTIPVTWPKGFTKSSITISYWQGATAPAADSTISPFIFVPNQSVMLHANHVGPVAERSLRRVLAFDSPARNFQAQVRGYIVGSVSLQLASVR